VRFSYVAADADHDDHGSAGDIRTGMESFEKVRTLLEQHRYRCRSTAAKKQRGGPLLKAVHQIGGPPVDLDALWGTARLC
jgi:hypothetical protein